MGAEGRREDGFLFQKAVSTFQRQAEPVPVVNCRHSDKPHEEEVLSAPFVLLLREQTQGQAPGFKNYRLCAQG